MTPEDMQFIERLFRSLESEMNGQFAELKAQFADVKTQLRQINDRLERQGGLINGGARAIAKMADWTEKTDTSLADVLRRQGEFEERLRRLEEKHSDQ